MINRGLERRDIFQDRKDYETFLKLLEKNHHQFKIIVHAYCLMTNHYHLFIETPEGNLSRVMRQLNGVYTQYFNYKYLRGGPLFQGRYKARLVGKDSYGLELVRYIHRNPVKAKIKRDAATYPYSSCGIYYGHKKKPVYMETDMILGQLSGRRYEARKKFKQFMRQGSAADWSPEKATVGGIVLGTKDYFVQLRDKYLLKKSDRELAGLRMIRKGLKTSEILKIVESLKAGGKELKKLKVYALKTYTQLSLKEIADEMGMGSYSAVSQLVRRMNLERIKNKRTNQLLAQLDRKMSNVQT